jgi:hypothetical protein
VYLPFSSAFGIYISISGIYLSAVIAVSASGLLASALYNSRYASFGVCRLALSAISRSHSTDRSFDQERLMSLRTETCLSGAVLF